MFYTVLASSQSLLYYLSAELHISLTIGLIYAQAPIEEEVEAPSTTPSLDVNIHTTFPQSEIFGVKLINGHATQSVLSVSNNEEAPITVAIIGGSLWSMEPTAPPQIIRNLTSVRYNVEIPAGEKESLSFAFVQDLQPADLRLNLAAVVRDQKGTFYTVQAFNETVSVVEPETSLLDPQKYVSLRLPADPIQFSLII